MYIENRKPQYPIADLVEVLKQIQRLDAVKLIIESLTEAKRVIVRKEGFCVENSSPPNLNIRWNITIMLNVM